MKGRTHLQASFFTLLGQLAHLHAPGGQEHVSPQLSSQLYFDILYHCGMRDPNPMLMKEIPTCKRPSSPCSGSSHTCMRPEGTRRSRRT